MADTSLNRTNDHLNRLRQEARQARLTKGLSLQEHTTPAGFSHRLGDALIALGRKLKSQPDLSEQTSYVPNFRLGN